MCVHRGRQPSHLPHLKPLYCRYLDFGNNGLVGSIPTEVTLLTNLVYAAVQPLIVTVCLGLDLFARSFGHALTWRPLSHCVVLNRHLDLYDNFLSSTIPADISVLTNLTYVRALLRGRMTFKFGTRQQQQNSDAGGSPSRLLVTYPCPRLTTLLSFST